MGVVRGEAKAALYGDCGLSKHSVRSDAVQSNFAF